MFRKLIVASAVVAISSSPAFAGNYKGDYKGEAVPAPCATYNPAVAPYFGISIGKQTTYSGSSRAYQGGNGTLSLGYGGIVAPDWYLAGEVFVDGTVTFNDSEQVNTLSLQNNWSYGISIIPGYMITSNLLGYLRVGGIETNFNETNGAWKSGWQVGVGGQTNIAQNWDLRAEYVWTYYSTFGARGRPLADAVNLGLIYRFT